jgi:hypothetical protein
MNVDVFLIRAAFELHSDVADIFEILIMHLIQMP